MISARRIAASLLVATVLLVTALPCPPTATTDGHASLSSSQGVSDRPLEFGRACPCSCETKGGNPVGAQLGFGLARAEESLPTPDSCPLTETRIAAVGEPAPSHEPIPI